MLTEEDTKNYISDKELKLIDKPDVLSKYNTLFFDNDPKNFKGFSGYNNLNILIDDSIPNEHIKKYVDPKERNWSIFLNSFRFNGIPFANELKPKLDPDNKYINAFATNSFGEKYTPVEGFTEIHTKIVYNWINSHNKENPLYLIFDWDRTLSVCEGFAINYQLINQIYNGKYTENDEYNPEVYNHILEYLMGGKRRHDMLKNFFNDICENHKNVEILVITSNTSAAESNKKRINFFNMVKLLIPCLTKDSFLYSGKTSKIKEFNQYKNNSQGQSNSKRPIITKEPGSQIKKSRKRGGRKNRAKKSRRYKR
jgi:hypothetical protein